MFNQHPFALLLVQIAVIVGLSRVAAFALRRAGQPRVIAEVLVGIVLGPSLLGWLSPATMNALFPPRSLGALQTLSQVGLVLFMFLVGLEINPGLLRGRTRATWAISHSSIVLPFTLGVAAAFGLHGRYSSPDVAFTGFALFMGVAMSVTAFPVLARILSERRMLSTPLGSLAIACAAVDDVTAWCLLPFVVAAAQSKSLVEAFITTAGVLAFAAVMFVAVRPLLRRLLIPASGSRELPAGAVPAVLVLLVLSSATTELLGVHALFGAFLFGAVLPRDAGVAHLLTERLETVAVGLLLPLFFAFSGLRTQLGLLHSAQDWWIAGGIVLLATLGKFGGGAVAARLTGLRWREAGAIGVLMNTRGLMELIVLNIGLDLGVLSPTLFTMMVVMAVTTTLATSPILGWLYPAARLAQLDSAQEAAPAPTRAG